jgi:ribosomal protein S18 acetylase RimI-like enzyme
MTLEPAFNIDAHPAPADLNFLDEQINQFNFAATGIMPEPDVLLAIIVRDEANEIVAGVWGWTWGGCCEIRTLWVHERLRGQGYGQRLLRAAEGEATRRGCRQVVLDTHSFQAPGFYRKHGYEVVGQVDGYPLGHTKYYLRKPLMQPA